MVGDDLYAKIANWDRHQSVHKPSKFRYPQESEGISGNSAALLPGDTSTSVEIPTAIVLDSYNPIVPDSNTKKRTASVRTPTEDEKIVVSHYLTVHPLRKAGSAAYRAAGKALASGYSPVELCEAIDGNAADSWHRDKGKHELAYVLRNEGIIDNFRDKARANQSPSVDKDGFLTQAGYERAMRD